MKATFMIATAVVALSACGPSIRVTTSVAPDATFSQLRTFRILTPTPRNGRSPRPNDPMLVNSISNQVLLTSITDAFVSRGYALDPTAPDFNIAYYATARERLDVELWDYGYPGRWGGWYPGVRYTAMPFTEGTVIVDVVDPKSNALLWRGRGVAVTSDDPADFQANLREAVQAIVKKFPRAVRHLAPKQ